MSQEIARENNVKTQQKNKARSDKSASEVPFKVGDKVLLRDQNKKKGYNPKFLANFKGPYIISKQLSPISFELAGTHSRMSNRCHANNLKFYVDIDKRLINKTVDRENNESVTLSAQ